MHRSKSKSNGHQSGHRSYQRPRTVEELTRTNIETILRLEEATKAKRSAPERAADGITRFCGSMRFVWVHVIWFTVWIGANLLLPKSNRFDPFPFGFLTLIVSLEAIFLSTFILISENRQAALNERRAQLDLQVNLLSEQENTKMLELLERIGKKLGVDVTSDPEVQVLEKATQPDKLLQQIDKTMAKSEKG